MVSIISCLPVWSHIYTHTPTHKEKRNREIDDTCLLQLARGDKVKCVCVCVSWLARLVCVVRQPNYSRQQVAASWPYRAAQSDRLPGAQCVVFLYAESSAVDVVT